MITSQSEIDRDTQAMASERIYQDENNQWFYSRRGDHAGPFETQDAARKELNKYLHVRDRKLNYDLFGSSFGLVKSMLRKLAA